MNNLTFALLCIVTIQVCTGIATLPCSDSADCPELTCPASEQISGLQVENGQLCIGYKECITIPGRHPHPFDTDLTGDFMNSMVTDGIAMDCGMLSTPYTTYPYFMPYCGSGGTYKPLVIANGKVCYDCPTCKGARGDEIYLCPSTHACPDTSCPEPVQTYNVASFL